MVFMNTTSLKLSRTTKIEVDDETWWKSRLTSILREKDKINLSNFHLISKVIKASYGMIRLNIIKSKDVGPSQLRQGPRKIESKNKATVLACPVVVNSAQVPLKDCNNYDEFMFSQLEDLCRFKISASSLLSHIDSLIQQLGPNIVDVLLYRLFASPYWKLYYEKKQLIFDKEKSTTFCDIDHGLNRIECTTRGTSESPSIKDMDEHLMKVGIFCFFFHSPRL